MLGVVNAYGGAGIARHPRHFEKFQHDLSTGAATAAESTDSRPATAVRGLRGQHSRVTWGETFANAGLVIATRTVLRAFGATDRMLTTAVRSGYLLRVRRGHYALPHEDPHVLRAVRIGGRLACASALRQEGIFAFDDATHVHMRKEASRSRSPKDRTRPLTARNRDGARLHWWPLVDPAGGTEYRVGLLDALTQVVRCGNPWHATASLDNALFLRRITESDIAEIFNSLPARYQPLRGQLDGRSEAGQESVLRCAFRAAGLQVELQVWIPGVGRVDMILEGRLIIEADSRLAHDGWELHLRDRNRDIDAARVGYMTLRPGYGRTMYATEDVVDAALALLRAPRRG